VYYGGSLQQKHAFSEHHVDATAKNKNETFSAKRESFIAKSVTEKKINR